jgi:hypothetical protein
MLLASITCQYYGIYVYCEREYLAKEIDFGNSSMHILLTAPPLFTPPNFPFGEPAALVLWLCRCVYKLSQEVWSVQAGAEYY